MVSRQAHNLKTHVRIVYPQQEKNMSMQLNFKKIHPQAKSPIKGNPGDAGIDLYTNEEVIFQSGEQKRIHTGIAMEIPDGYVGFIWDKSGISFKQGLKIVGGVIDCGYRGEIIVSMINLSNEVQTISLGQKFTQIIIQKFEDCILQEVDFLSDSERGEGREGSTGIY